MDKTQQNIELAKITVELCRLCAADSSSNPYNGLRKDLPYGASTVEAFDAIYDHLRSTLIEER